MIGFRLFFLQQIINVSLNYAQFRFFSIQVDKSNCRFLYHRRMEAARKLPSFTTVDRR